MKRLFILILIFPIILVNSASAEEVVLKDPSMVNELSVSVKQYGTIAFEGEPSKITVNLTIPQDDVRQDVKTDITKIKNTLGTELGVVEGKPEGNVFDYSVTSEVISRANHLLSLPKSYTIPEGVEIYMEATENMQSEDPAIKNLAEEITKNARDNFEKIALLAIWVHDNLDYDLSYAGSNLDALTVLESKKGVCAEYTTLFTALSRSLGIPARYVSAWAYGELGWERHAYAEVYLGKWIPVDALWLEVGYLDATHMSFGNYLDNSVSNEVQVTGIGVKNIRWVTDETDLEIKDYSLVEKQENYMLSVSSDSFRIGEEGIIMLKLIPEEYMVAKITLEPCYGDYQTLTLEDKDRKVILRPGEVNIVYWKFRINQDLPENMVITCPLTLNSRSLSIRAINTEVNTQKVPRKDLVESWLGSDLVKLGENQEVHIEVSKKSGSGKVGVISGNHHKEWSVSGGEDLSFSFPTEKTRENEVVVYSSFGGVNTLTYTAQSSFDLFIEDFSVPRFLKVGEQGKGNITIKNTGAAEKTASLKVFVGDEEETYNFQIKDEYEIPLSLSFVSTGFKTLKAVLKSDGFETSKTKKIEVYEEPELVLEGSYDPERGMVIIKIEVIGYRADNITIKIGDQEKHLDQLFGKTELGLKMDKGKHQVRITYQDAGEEGYEMTKTLDFQEPGILEIIINAINGFIEQIKKLFGIL